jgi:hypothetical protein
LTEKNGLDAGCLPAAKRLQDLDVPDLSSGKSRKLPLLLRCAFAPWREAKNSSHAKPAKPQRKADRLNGREGLDGKTSKLFCPQKAFRTPAISSSPSCAGSSDLEGNAKMKRSFS